MKQLIEGVNDVIIELGSTDRLLGEHNFSEVGAVTETLCLFFKNNRLWAKFRKWVIRNYSEGLLGKFQQGRKDNT